MIDVSPYVGSPFAGVRRALAQAPVVVYGTRWCVTSQMVRCYLDRLGVPYRYVDLDPGAGRQLAFLTGGYVSHPTVSVGGELLVEPNLSELEWALAGAGVV